MRHLNQNLGRSQHNQQSAVLTLLAHAKPPRGEKHLPPPDPPAIPQPLEADQHAMPPYAAPPRRERPDPPANPKPLEALE